MGSESSLDSFIDHINKNVYGMKFTVTTHKNNIDFLDLHTFKQDCILYTKKQFKSTDRNGYIPTRSCHPPKWKMAISKGQFIHIKRNCSLQQDYIEQTDTLIHRFMDKGYPQNTLLKIREQVGASYRQALLTTKEKAEREYDVTFITSFSKQFKTLEQSIKKNWFILQIDPILSKVLPIRPKCIYRRAPGSRTRLVKNIPDPP